MAFESIGTSFSFFLAAFFSLSLSLLYATVELFHTIPLVKMGFLSAHNCSFQMFIFFSFSFF